MLIQDVKPPKFNVVHINVFNEWSTYYLIDGEWTPF